MSHDETIKLPEKRRTILVVEDNDINREMIATLLEDEYDMLEAYDGLMGIEMLKEHHAEISLVLLDVYMPKCNGFDFLRFRATDDRYSNIPVIVTTASESIHDEVECLKLGANDFVVKPYDVDIIQNRIQNTISLRETASIVNHLTWDEITHLYRAEFFYRYADDLLEAYPHKSYDLICTDINNFKVLNERYGRHGCDQLLADLADAISDTLPSLISGRIGGDSFAYLVEHQQDGAWIERLDTAVREANPLNVFLKVGIVPNVDHTIPCALLCDHAIMALSNAKGSTGVGIAYYDNKLHERQLMEQLILESMEDALARHEFAVHFQPKHNSHTDRIEGAEALVRWNHPELGFIRPDLFISVFEQNGLITQLDMYVCDEACREISRCIDLGLPAVPISINISRTDIDNGELVPRIEEMVERHGIDRSMLHLELTETAFSENPHAVKTVLDHLRTLGYKIELDDFGSGYSALAELNQIPLDVLKLDGSMIRQASKTGDFRIVEASLLIAKLLGLETVVEGVETAEELERLRDMDCNLIQGYYYARPMDRTDFERYLQEH